LAQSFGYIHISVFLMKCKIGYHQN